jgi:glyceraldehyde 3-phosphate dehydrogenase
MQGILGVSDEPLVSMDFKGDTRSSIIDADSTMSLGGNFVKVIAWYDNEWGYSCRVADLVAFVAQRLDGGTTNDPAAEEQPSDEPVQAAAGA